MRGLTHEDDAAGLVGPVVQLLGVLDPAGPDEVRRELEQPLNAVGHGTGSVIICVWHAASCSGDLLGPAGIYPELVDGDDVEPTVFALFWTGVLVRPEERNGIGLVCALSTGQSC